MTPSQGVGGPTRKNRVVPHRIVVAPNRSARRTRDEGKVGLIVEIVIESEGQSGRSGRDRTARERDHDGHMTHSACQKTIGRANLPPIRRRRCAGIRASTMLSTARSGTILSRARAGVIVTPGPALCRALRKHF